MVDLNSTVASVPAREYAFVLTDATNARRGKRGEGDGKPDIKVNVCWVSQKTTSSLF